MTRIWKIAFGVWAFWTTVICADFAVHSQTGKHLVGSSVIPTSFSATNITVTSLGGSGTILTQANNSGALASAALTPTQATQRGYYGDGSTGTCTFDGTAASNACATKNSSTSYTQSADCLCATITLSAPVTLHTNGWRTFSAGLATINGIIDNSGGAGAAGTGTGTAAGGTAPGCNSVGGGATTLSPGAGAGSGATGLTGSALGGAGGGGGVGGGTGGTVAFAATGFSYRQPPEAISTLVPAAGLPPSGSQSLRPIMGGAGGGGGKNASNCGGGGGAGGGVVVTWFESWAGNGTVQANGGIGGNACATGTDSPGGGGGGGFVSAGGSNISSWAGGFGATGGLAGTGNAGGAGAGSTGTVVTISS